MDTKSTSEGLRVGLQVRSADGQTIGEVAEVWPDVGVGESWGAAGSFPRSGAEATDPAQFAFTEAMPGEGDSYFRMSQPGGQDLYIPFSAVSETRGDAVVLAVDAADVPSMQWDVQPDFVNITTTPDSQGGPHTA